MHSKKLVSSWIFSSLIILNLSSCEQSHDEKLTHLPRQQSLIPVKASSVILPSVQYVQGWSATKIKKLQYQTAQALAAKLVFQDVLYINGVASGEYGPRMVIIPAGIHSMGCHQNSEVCFPRETKSIRVTHSTPFAVSETEITYRQWQHCLLNGGCTKSKHHVFDNLESKLRKPMVNVSWHEAQAYVRWLSKATSQNYRLLSESEWEYAAKASSDSAYNLGNSLNCRLLKYQSSSSNNCYYTHEDNDYEFSPIKSKKANAFGLFGMHSHVWEWTQDCWSNYLSITPRDGTAYKLKKTEKNPAPKCELFIASGGAWAGIFRRLRASNHYIGRKSSHYNDQGFRIARDL